MEGFIERQQGILRFRHLDSATPAFCRETSVIRYTLMTVRRVPFLLFAVALFSVCCLSEETSFQRIKAPDSKGKPVKAVLTFSDQHQAVEITPVKGKAVSIPYRAIDKFVYEYTKKHRVNDVTVATAPIGVGAAAMLTKARNHWLEIDYTEENIPHKYVVRMDKRNYLRILDAAKKHTGKEAEVLGNADKRKK